MTLEEGKKAIEQLKAEGHSEKEILGAFYKMFQNDKLTLEELDGMVNLMGYHLTDDFKAMSPEDQKTKGYEETEEAAEGVDSEEVEEAKETEGGEKAETEGDNEDSGTDNSEDSGDSDNSDDSDDDEEFEEDSDEEKEYVMKKLFGN